MNFGSKILGFIATLLFLFSSFTVQAKEGITVGIFYGWPTLGIVGLVDASKVSLVEVGDGVAAVKAMAKRKVAAACAFAGLQYLMIMVPLLMSDSERESIWIVLF